VALGLAERLPDPGDRGPRLRPGQRPRRPEEIRRGASRQRPRPEGLPGPV